jgi:ATP-dependent helicase/nuclease subunit B
LIDILTASAENLCGEAIWAREDGRALAQFVEDFRLHAREVRFTVDPRDVASVLKDAMEGFAVRPPYGGHARVQVLGLLEARMNRADLVICGGLNEGVWPARGGVDALLAPPVMRALGVPGSDFRTGLSAHDLAGALGAPEVVLSRSVRDESGPAIPSRFLLRIQALLYDSRRNHDLSDRHREVRAIELARALNRAGEARRYPRPEPMPTPEQRRVDISATALDRLRGDPYQFFASKILNLTSLDALDAEPSAAWRGEVAHEILERWHKDGEGRSIAEVMDLVFRERNVHPLMRGLWQPRLEAALRWVESEIGSYRDRKVAAVEAWGEMHIDGVRVHGKIDRLDRLADGSLGIIDYKTGSPPSTTMVAEGYALQLGLLGMMAERGGFEGVVGKASGFEYWSLGKAKSEANAYGFGYVETPLKSGKKRSGIEPCEFLPKTEEYLANAIARWITGNEPFTARLNPDYPAYDTYDQLMRLEEWLPHLDSEDPEL